MTRVSKVWREGPFRGKESCKMERNGTETDSYPATAKYLDKI